MDQESLRITDSTKGVPVHKATVLALHNRYVVPGGEEVAFASETALLEARGHRVVKYVVQNEPFSGWRKGTVGVGALWSEGSYRAVQRLIDESEPTVVHCHNTFPLISPSVYYAARRRGVPVVQTIHNYRLVCVNGLLFRDGRPCGDCVGKRVAWPGVRNACYHNSTLQSTSVAGMVALHRMVGTWSRQVSAFVAPTFLSRSMLLKVGAPSDKVHIVPNFVPTDPGVGRHGSDYILFVGRLSHEKGIETFVQALRALGGTVRARIVGGGPLEAWVMQEIRSMDNVSYHGSVSKEQVAELMKDATALIVPSLCFEVFPTVIVEAFATGLPVIASGHGAMAEILEDGQTGVLFPAGDADALAHAIRSVMEDSGLRLGLARAGRANFDARYDAGHHYESLVRVYEAALASA